MTVKDISHRCACRQSRFHVYGDVTIGCHALCAVIINVLATEQSKYVPLNFFDVDG